MPVVVVSSNDRDTVNGGGGDDNVAISGGSITLDECDTLYPIHICTNNKRNRNT